MEPIFDISVAEIVAFFENALETIKDFFAKLGILVLPEEDELPKK